MAFCKFCGREFKDNHSLDAHMLFSFQSGNCKDLIIKETTRAKFDIVTGEASEMNKLEEGQTALYNGEQVFRRINGYVQLIGKLRHNDVIEEYSHV